jgi:hypothetical protein
MIFWYDVMVGAIWAIIGTLCVVAMLRLLARFGQ